MIVTWTAEAVITLYSAAGISQPAVFLFYHMEKSTYLRLYLYMVN
jgi:hypothetical protein